MINRESSLHLKAVKIKLSFPQQIVEEHEHVRDTTHPPKHYGCIYVTRSLYEVTFPMSYRNVGSSCPHYRERRRSPHRTDSDALYAVGGGNTGPASSVTTNFTPNYLDKKHRREDTPVFYSYYGAKNNITVFTSKRRFSLPCTLTITPTTYDRRHNIEPGEHTIQVKTPFRVLKP